MKNNLYLCYLVVVFTLLGCEVFIDGRTESAYPVDMVENTSQIETQNLNEYTFHFISKLAQHSIDELTIVNPMKEIRTLSFYEIRRPGIYKDYCVFYNMTDTRKIKD